MMHELNSELRASGAPRRHLASFGASLAAHVAALGAILWLAPALTHPHHEFVLAYLVELGGKSGAGRGSSAPVHKSAGAIAPATQPRMRRPHERSSSMATGSANAAPVRASAERSRALDDRAARAVRADAPASSMPPGGDAASGGGSADAGAGGGAADPGSGAGDRATTLAYADYGSSPPPRYPERARRRDQQGVVTIRVLVGDDGSVERAEIASSSGFDSLDRAALETVLSRWRFVPARRDGITIESWVLVPIRFALK